MFGAVVAAALAVAVGLVRGSSDEGNDNVAYAPRIEPGSFTSEINNPFLPLQPGRRWIYEARTGKGLERIVVEVTHDRRVVKGVTCVVVRDTVTLDGVVVEDTSDWYAQDSTGNVWYFGEDTKAYEDGKVDATGTWEAGVDGAQPGIVMPAQPQVGARYRQEYYAENAEDMAEVLNLREQASVAGGDFRDLLVIKDYSPLHPGAVEHKYYAAGVGKVLEVTVEGGDKRLELVRMTIP